MKFEDWQSSNYEVVALRQKCVGRHGTKVEVSSVKASWKRIEKAQDTIEEKR